MLCLAAPGACACYPLSNADFSRPASSYGSALVPKVWHTLRAKGRLFTRSPPTSTPHPTPNKHSHSPPDVPYRETVAAPAELPPEVAPKPPRVVEATTPSGACTLRVRAVPLPATLAMGLDQHADLLARLAGAGQVQRPC